MFQKIFIAAIVSLCMALSGCVDDENNNNNGGKVNQPPRIGLDQYGRIVNPQNVCPKLASTMASFNQHDSEHVICQKQQHNAQIACDQNECGQWACGYSKATTEGNACLQRCDYRYYQAMVQHCTGKSLQPR